MPRKTKNVNVNEQATETQATEAAEATPAAENANTESPKAEAKPICLTPGCGAKPRFAACAPAAELQRKAIKDGKATWAKLEALGLAIPPKKAAFGGGEPGVFAKALAAKLADKKD